MYIYTCKLIIIAKVLKTFKNVYCMGLREGYAAAMSIPLQRSLGRSLIHPRTA